MSDSFPKSIELKKRSLHERVIVAKVLLESVLDDLPSVQPELANNSKELDKEIGECNDCIKHGGDWECDRVHCHKGDVPDTNVGELISRQDAIDAIVNTVSEVGNHDNSEVARYGATFRQHEILDIIESLSPTQPRKGKWIDYSDEGYVECPFCHSATNCDGNKDELHYCFSCGAELRGEQE